MVDGVGIESGVGIGVGVVRRIVIQTGWSDQ